MGPVLFAESCTRRLRCLVSLSSSLCQARCSLSRGFIAFVLPISFGIFVKESAPLLLQRTPLCGFLGVFRVGQTLPARLSPGVWLGERGGCGLPGILRDISRLLPGVVRAEGNGQSGALGFTSRSAVPVCYLGQVCFPLSACPSSCVTRC